MRILIVEDELLLGLQLELDLADHGHDVAGVARAKKEALKLAAETDFDLAFIDLGLADGFTGLEVAAEISAAERPVILLTGSAEQVPPDGAGAVGLLNKPYHPDALAATLAYLSQANDDPPPPAPADLRLFTSSGKGAAALG